MCTSLWNVMVLLFIDKMNELSMSNKINILDS